MIVTTVTIETVVKKSGGYKDGYVGLILGVYSYKYTLKKYLKSGLFTFLSM